MTEPDLSKIKPQPYESFEETERKHEEEATVVNPLTERQKEIVREQSGINPVSQTVGDALKDADEVPETEDRFKDKE